MNWKKIKQFFCGHLFEVRECQLLDKNSKKIKGGKFTLVTCPKCEKMELIEMELGFK